MPASELYQLMCLGAALTKSAGIGEWLANSPYAVSMLGNGLLGGVVGAGVGAARSAGRPNDYAANTALGGLIGGGAGALYGMLSGHETESKIRESREKPPPPPDEDTFGSNFWGSVGSNLRGDPVLAVYNPTSLLTRSVIGAAGHDDDSRTWDTFWGGGGTSGALSSALDHYYNGPSSYAVRARLRKKKKKKNDND